MSHKPLSTREDLIRDLHKYHLDICDVALVLKPSADAADTKNDGSDHHSNYEATTKAHSSVLSCFSSILKKKLKGMLRSSEGLYVVTVDLDVSTEGIEAFINCLYGKPFQSFDHDVVSDVLKLASLYKVPLFIFEELFSTKSIYLCLDECLKRVKEEAENLLESCKEMLKTNCAIYEDKSLFQDLNVDLFKWIADLNELPIANLSTYLIEFAVDRQSFEMLSEIKSDVANWDRRDRRITEILKIEKRGDKLTKEIFSIRYQNDSINDILEKASSYSLEKFLPQNSCLYLQENSKSRLEMTSLLTDHKLKPGDTVCIEVKKRVEIRTIDGLQKQFFLDFDAKRIRDLKVQVSDFLGTKDINKIVLTKDRQILDDMKTLDKVSEKKGDHVFSASLHGDPVDANQVVVAYGDDNVAAWPEVVFTAAAHVKGREPVNALGLINTKVWESKLQSSNPQSRNPQSSCQHWLQCEFRFPIVIGLFQFCGRWGNNDGTHFFVSAFKIEGSLDEENWIPLFIKREISEWGSAEAKTFICQNTKAFKLYRLTILKTTEAGTADVLLYKLRFSESLF